MIQEILELLRNFTARKLIKLSKNQRKNPVIFHYYHEIIRFWNKLNFIIKRTLIALKKDFNLNLAKIPLLLFLTYQKIFENKSSDSLMEELIKSKIIPGENLEKREIIDFLDKLDTFSWDLALKSKSIKEKLSIREAIPSFFIKILDKVMDVRTIEDNIRIMNRFKEKKYFSIHLKEDIEFEFRNPNFIKDAKIPNLYHIPSKLKIDFLNSKDTKSGNLIILDKASATVINILSPQPQDFILDMCAAPGIKTSLISHFTKAESNLIAIDFSRRRTKEMRSFTQRFNYKKLFILNSDSISIPLRPSLKFNKILLDAPCTGSGTFLSNPELKWKQNERFLHQNMVLQEKLIRSAIELLSPSGILVYSTCSLYPEEGEYQIKKFVDKLEPMKLPKWLGKSYQIEGSIIPGTARLFPAQHLTEGFFIAKFKKKE